MKKLGVSKILLFLSLLFSIVVYIYPLNNQDLYFVSLPVFMGICLEMVFFYQKVIKIQDIIALMFFIFKKKYDL